MVRGQGHQTQTLLVRNLLGKKKTFAVKADVVGRARVVRAMIQKVDVLVNHVRLSCVAVHDN